jgi:arsenate reductase (thioredoxin)
MAEGWARELAGDVIEAYSAGVEPKRLDAQAVKVMHEAGVDISGQRSKHIDELKDVPFDIVVTVCDNAHEACPHFPNNAKLIHAGFDDPPRLASHAKSEEEAIGHYRCVRDEIRVFIDELARRERSD